MEQLTFKEFTEQALRTESTVSELKINTYVLGNLVDMYIKIGTVLDYMKKGIFYNNYTKYNNYMEKLLIEVSQKAHETAYARYHDHKELDVNYRVLHGLLGVMTESSELAEHLQLLLSCNEIDAAGIAEEFGDCDWYKAIVFDELNLSENASRTNIINKLKVRYPEKYSDELAENRTLDLERVELEKNITS